MAFFLNLIIALVLMVISYLLTPQPKMETPAVKDMEGPTAEAGKPLPVVFGTMTVKGLNALWYGDKKWRKVEIDG